MKQAKRYETDFFGWTKEQATHLRTMAHIAGPLDVENLAEEIEGIGRLAVGQVSVFLMQALLHVIKIACDPDAQSVAHWVAEADNFQRQALVAYSPGLKQRLDVPKMWKLAKRGATNALAEFNVSVPSLPEECPLDVDQLLADDFSPREAAATILACISFTRGKTR